MAYFMAERYLTTADVNEIMSNLDQMAAFRCLGRMSDFVDRYKQDQIERYRWMG